MCFALLLIVRLSTSAQTVTASIPVASTPAAIAVNPLTNPIYVADPVGSAVGQVSVIDGRTNGTTSVTVGRVPIDVAVSPITDKIYVANRGVLFVAFRLESRKYKSATPQPRTSATQNSNSGFAMFTRWARFSMYSRFAAV
ncbi:MAG TPA: hypothetical protein VGS27_01940 [Candidatus Sulfotelmatobacter sp.]|nr:hypothetical protein [Candidatus Sulfotelmatobacter sp.]